MFAINHATTALIIKKNFKDVPIIWLLISVQFMELLWVLPVPAFVLEIVYGTACWWIYGGSIVLLGVILLFNLANLPMFIAALPGAKQKNGK